ncbi:thiolase family protein [Corynebacterium sp.]|uniref:thiolase family protein n=1 Tax=Corynebacterium sp. TaxID=1720 RepID=UPI0028A71F18|nr:thiolase family protein [Corynebacterium sp.]
MMDDSTQAAIVAASRTAIGRRNGALAEFDAAELGGFAIDNLDVRSLERGVTDVYWGNTLSHYGNTGRISVLMSALPIETPAITVDRQCGSGISTVAMAAAAVNVPGAKPSLIIAGGSESMTNEPHLLDINGRNPKFLRRELSSSEVGDPVMGITAENLRRKFNIDRIRQDEFALSSQQKFAESTSQGISNEFLIPVQSSNGLVDADEHPRPTSNLESLSKLRPAFEKEGTVTAGNASGINDAAAAVAVMNKEGAQNSGIDVLAYIGHTAVVGVDPNYMGIGPVPAIQKLLKTTGRKFKDYDVIEINEAFAVQVLACVDELGLTENDVNPIGGAIAHGHPIAATGTILIQKAISQLRSRGGGRAIVSACIGGGMGIATEIVVRD